MDEFNNGGTPATQFNNVTYNWGTTTNNGNLQGATWNYGGAGASNFTPFSQTFTFDTVNQLKTANDTGRSRNYFYDAYGNMAERGSGVPFDLNAPVTANNSVAGLYNTNNQLTVAGMVYDKAGNLSQLSGYSSLTYDGENPQFGVSTAVEYSAAIRPAAS